MFTEWDDYPIHQTVSTFDRPDSSDRRWYDRYWFAMGRVDGEVLLEAGLGVYPNLNVTDAFALVTWQGCQYNVRLSRRLDEDRTTVIGPFALEVVQGARAVRLSLRQNDFDISFDVLFEASTPPYVELPYFFEAEGKTISNFAHVNQAGRWSGSITVARRSYTVEKETWWGERDRSWGVRPGVGSPEALGGGASRGLVLWVPTQFSTFSLFCTAHEAPEGEQGRCEGGIRYPYGSPREKEILKIIGVEHHLEFHSGSRQFKAGEIILTDPQGNRLSTSVRSLTCCHLEEGGYGHPTSYHGADRGPLVHIEGERQDLSSTKWRSPHAPDHFAEFRWGDVAGYGIFEYMLGSYRRYGFG